MYLQDAIFASGDSLENDPVGMGPTDRYIGMADEEATFADEAVLIGDSNSHSHEKREAHEHISPKELAGSAVGSVLSTCSPVSGPLASGTTLPDVENP